MGRRRRPGGAGGHGAGPNKPNKSTKPTKGHEATLREVLRLAERENDRIERERRSPTAHELPDRRRSPRPHLTHLVSLARTGPGLVSPAFRRRAWPLLMGAVLASETANTAASSSAKRGNRSEPFGTRSEVAEYLWDVARLREHGVSPCSIGAGGGLHKNQKKRQGKRRRGDLRFDGAENAGENAAGAAAEGDAEMVASWSMWDDAYDLTRVPKAHLPPLSELSEGADVPEIFRHKEADQVRKDVVRSLWDVEPTAGLRGMRRQQLIRIVLALLHRQPRLHYFQGLHDVVAVFLRTTEDVLSTFVMAERLALWHLQFALETSLFSTQQILSLLFPLIHRADPELGDFLARSEVEPIFALAWVLTWFSHSVADIDHAARLFDVFLCSHPLFPLYVAAAFVRSVREDLLQTVECDMPSVHTFLTKLPIDQMPLEDIIADALQLFDKHPPSDAERGDLKLPYEWMQGHTSLHHTALSLLVPVDHTSRWGWTRLLVGVLVLVFSGFAAVIALLRAMSFGESVAQLQRDSNEGWSMLWNR
jgi:Rab-GTPase-TBC domain